MMLRTKGEQKAYLDGFEWCADCIEKYLTDEGKRKLEGLLIAVRNAVEIEDIETGIGNCKNCKWWRDHDGLYRRGSHAESKCPINRREVFEGNGYCYMFERRK